jgi:phosphatidylserine/phosphatidylglycerophosphate/cardiolipin synthase-like enzyme
MHNSGIDTWIDSEHAIAHNKVMVIDSRTVITGGFNFTKQAEKSNAENLLVIRSQELAGKFVENCEKFLGHSEKYEGEEKAE